MDAEAAVSSPVSGSSLIKTFYFNVSGTENVIEMNGNLNSGVQINGSVRIGNSSRNIYF